MTFWLPAATAFSIACRMSSGARNCPFFTLTARPVFAAAWIRSVWRERNAGICSTSATSAAGAACDGSWMSVRIGTPAASRTCPRTRRPCSSPGPRNDFDEVRLALSYDALKTSGTPARRVISTSASAVSTACASLSMTHGPAMSTSAPPPNVTLPAATSRTGGGATRLPYHGGRRMIALRDLVAVTCLHESGEERVRLERLRLELGVELHGDVPWMRRQLDDLDELAVERAADDLEALVGERLLVETVELVAVAMPLVDHVAAVQRVRRRSGLELARVRS